MEFISLTNVYRTLKTIREQIGNGAQITVRQRDVYGSDGLEITVLWPSIDLYWRLELTDSKILKGDDTYTLQRIIHDANILYKQKRPK